MMKEVAIKAVLAAGLLALAAATVGCAARALERQEYVLRGVVPSDGPASPAPADGLGPAVSIGPVELPQYLRRPQIVTRADGNRVSAAESHVWAESLSRSMARAVLANVSAGLPTGRAWLFSDVGAGAPDYRVAIRVDDFAADAAGLVLLDARWTVSGADANDVRVARRTRATLQAQTRSYESIVDAMIELVGQLSREIAVELRSQADRSQSASRSAVSLADRSSASGLAG